MHAIPKRLCLIALLLAGCGKWADKVFCSSAGCAWGPGEWDRVAALASPGAPPPDRSNALVGDPGAEALGRMFFFDPAFSGAPTQLDAIDRPSPPARPATTDGTVKMSCASCHDLGHGGVDITSVPGHVSVGVGWTDVNALSVMNSAFRNVVFWNGRADSLWALNVIVAESKTTLGGNRLRTAHQLVSRYRDQLIATGGAWLLRQFQSQFSGISCSGIDDLFTRIAAAPPDGKPGNGTCDTTVAGEPFGDAFDCLDADVQKAVTTLLVIWSKAIAAYEYKLISGPTDFDRYVQEGPDSTRISAAAQRGARLFVGKASCVDCHSGPQLTDEVFHDIGIPQTGVAVPTTADCPASDNPRKASCDCASDAALKCAPWGAYDGLRRLQETDTTSPIFNKWLRTRSWSDDKTDTSRAAYVNMPLDGLKGAWRTPSLRNVALTAPYMHDGRYATLQDVIWHYNTGGKMAGPEQVGHLAPEIKPLMLTDDEQADLIAFLETLTGALPDADAPADQKFTTRPTLPASDATSTTSVCSSTQQTTCPGTVPPSPLIADFSDVSGSGTMIRYGTAPNITGGAFTYAAPGLTPPTLSFGPGLPNGTIGLNVAARPGSPTDSSNTWFGFGLYFDACVDASVFGGVHFTINGNLGTCAVRFAVTSAENAYVGDDPRGTCLQKPCYQPSVVISGPGDFAIPLNLSGFPVPGSPNVVDPRSLIGVQWQMDAPPGGCDASLSIDDVAFVGVLPSGAGGAGGSRVTGSGGAGGLGVAGAAGSIGGPGAGGAGGSIGPTPPICHVAPAPSLIADFSSTMASGSSVVRVGGQISGTIAGTAPLGVTPPILSVAPLTFGVSPPVLQVMSHPFASDAGDAWLGVNFTFDNCVDASAFNAVRFTLNNSLTNCPLSFAVVSAQDVGQNDDPRGTCTGGPCQPTFTTIPATSGPITIPLGIIAPSPVIGIRWRAAASCGLLFSVDDITFTNQ